MPLILTLPSLLGYQRCLCNTRPKRPQRCLCNTRVTRTHGRRLCNDFERGSPDLWRRVRSFFNSWNFLPGRGWSGGGKWRQTDTKPIKRDEGTFTRAELFCDGLRDRPALAACMHTTHMYTALNSYLPSLRIHVDSRHERRYRRRNGSNCTAWLYRIWQRYISEDCDSDSYKLFQGRDMLPHPQRVSEWFFVLIN